MSSPQPSRQPQVTTEAKRSILKARSSPTMGNVVNAVDSLADAVENVHGDLKADVGRLEGKVDGLQVDVTKLLEYYGITSGSNP